MIGYVTLGTNDLSRAASFYDALLAELGGKRFMEMDTFIAWAGPSGKGGIGLTQPFDGQPATVGNGVMVALECDSNEQVDKIYQKAMELGATCEGPVGFRGDTFYAGYFRDPDGNKLNAYFMSGPM